jgi:hypothetical protein
MGTPSSLTARILPGDLSLPHQHAVAAVCIAAQLIEVFDKPGSDRVKMDVAYKFQEIGVLMAQNGFKASVHLPLDGSAPTFSAPYPA